MARVVWKVNDGAPQSLDRRVGNMPIMVGSSLCHLHGLSPEQLIKHREEARELGGYFICNGNERVLRLLAMPRRNHVTATIRPAFTKRGPTYTHFGCSIRCVKRDATSSTNVLHYLTGGLVNFRFAMRRQEFFIPAGVLLKALIETTDRSIYESLIQGRPFEPSTLFLSDFL